MSTDTLILAGRHAGEVSPSRAALATDGMLALPAYSTGRWVFGSKLHLPDFTALQAAGVWLLCRVLGVPCAIPTLRSTFSIREKARERCTSRRDYIMWIPDDAPMGSELEDRRFYCEPLNDPDLDARHAELFAFERAEAESL